MAVTDFLGNFDPKIALVGAFAPRTAQRMRNEKNRKKILELLNVDDDLLATQQQASALAQEQEALDAKAADISNMLQDEASITAMTESEIQQLREDAAFPRTNMTDQEAKNVETLRQMEAGPTPLPITGEEIRQLRAQKSGQQQLDVAEKKLEEAGPYKGNIFGLTNERAKMVQDVLASMPADIALDTFGGAVKQQLAKDLRGEAQLLDKAAIKKAGFREGTVAQIIDGQLQVLQSPPAAKESFTIATDAQRKEFAKQAGIDINAMKDGILYFGENTKRPYYINFKAPPANTFFNL
tara:strand:+ start:16 stop:903 length:888 start_codon:yes stop_codon:yes gene_type:complete